MPNFLDIFNNKAFEVTSLTDAINDLAYRPYRIGNMGLFSTTSVATTSVAIERIGDVIQLVAPTPRGGPGEIRDNTKRSITSLTVPHFERDWSVVADEVQNLRAYGSEGQLETVQNMVIQKIAENSSDIDLTEEHARIGAIKGIITYKGGQTLDLFTTFGITQAAEIDFDLDNATPTSGALMAKCNQVILAMQDALGGVPMEGVHALVGNTFFAQLLAHKELQATYLGWGDARILRESYIGPNRSNNRMLEFGGITWENYGASSANGDGALMGIAATEARFFPVGVRNMFRTYYAPADYVETVNTMGKRLYAKQWPMPNGKGINGEVQSNMLHIATRPQALLRAKNT